ncbi:MAG: DUF4124 domain-containing protein [Gammaproteobacteria bacterium]|nr:DUF4124 domain-containing protein [Gammaproteobacteria bacterium]
MRYLLNLLMVLIFAGALPAQAKMYKWEDADGNVHFGDRIPLQYQNQEHQELNAQGAVTQEHEAVVIKTEKEKQEALRLEHLEKQRQKIAEAKALEQAKQDRVLLDTYTTERDLTAARDARLDAVDSQLQLSESIIADTERKLDLTEKQVTRIRASGKEVPGNISEKLNSEKRQLQTYREAAAGHQKRKQQINRQFEDYIARFSELKEQQQRIKEAREARRKEAMGL